MGLEKEKKIFLSNLYFNQNPFLLSKQNLQQKRNLIFSKEKMEEDKKQETEKQLKLKVYPFSTEETIDLKLNSILSVQNFQLIVKANYDYNLIFRKVKDYLIKQNHLNSLNLIFRSLKNFDFEQTIYQFKDLNQITQLSFEFDDHATFSTNQQQTLGSSIQSFTNLISLELGFSCQNLQYNDKYFQLREAYLNFSHLKILKLQLFDFEEGSIVYYNFVEGIRWLKNLEEFKFSISYKIKTSFVIESIQEELKEIVGLKKLSLIFGWYSQLSYQDFYSIGNILKCLTNLEILRIQGNCFESKDKRILLGLEDSLSEIKQLKQLKMQIHVQNEQYILFMMESISQITSLETVLLHFTFKEITEEENSYNILGSQLAKISKLKNLKLSFWEKVSQNQISVLVSKLQPLQSLVSLEIVASSMETIQNKNLILESIEQVVSNLQRLRISVSEETRNLELFLIGEYLLSSLKDQTNLEDLKLSFQSSYFDEFNLQEFKISDLLKNKRNLKALKLSIHPQYYIQKNEFNQFLKYLAENPFLIKIEFKFGNRIFFNPGIMESLSNSLSQLNELKKLHIEFEKEAENTDEICFKSYCEALAGMKKLETLKTNILKDKLNPNDLNLFISQLNGFKKMKILTLNIFGNNFNSDEEEQKFGVSFRLPPKIDQLRIQLEIPNLKYQNFDSFFEQISLCKKIDLLDLSIANLEVNQYDINQIRKYLSLPQLLKIIKIRINSIYLVDLLNLFTDNQILESIELSKSMQYYDSLMIKRKIIYKRDDKKRFNLNHQADSLNIGHLTEKFSLKICNYQIFTQDMSLEEIKSIQFMLNNIRFINKLNLYYSKDNKLRNKGVMELFKIISNFNNLQSLVIVINQNNFIGNEGFIQIGESLNDLSSLKSLKIKTHIIENLIDLEKCDTFCERIGSLQQLEYLDFTIYFNFRYNNNQTNIEINERFINLLFSSIQNLKCLKEMRIRIYRQNLSSSNILTLNQMLGQLKENLEVLELDFDKYEQQLFQCLRQLMNLKYLVLNCLSEKKKYAYKIKSLVEISQY